MCKISPPLGVVDRWGNLRLRLGPGVRVGRRGNPKGCGAVCAFRSSRALAAEYEPKIKRRVFDGGFHTAVSGGALGEAVFPAFFLACRSTSTSLRMKPRELHRATSPFGTVLAVCSDLDHANVCGRRLPSVFFLYVRLRVSRAPREG